MNTIGNVHIFVKFIFPAGRSTKHSVDRLLADYIGFYRQGFCSVVCLSLFCDEVRRVLKFVDKIDTFRLFKPNFTLKIE